MEKSRRPKDYSKQATDPKKSKESSQEEEEEEDGRVRKKTLVSFPSGNALSLSQCVPPPFYIYATSRENKFIQTRNKRHQKSPPHQTRRSRTSFSSRHFDSPKREKNSCRILFW
jgi:hypothetical protein